MKSRPLWLPPLFLIVLFTSSCGPPSLPAGPRVKPPQGGGEGGKYQCRDVTGSADPWLVEWTPAAKVRLQSSSQNGVLVVKYQGCNLEVLYGCEVDGAYTFNETTRSRQTEIIDNEAELFAKLPIGALNLAGEFKKGDHWSLEYVLVGTRTASVKNIPRASLSGNCAGATHFVQGMAVGAYQLSAKAHRKVGAEASLKGVAGAGGKIGAEARRLRQDGQYEKCIKDATKSSERGCQAIVQLYLRPVSGSTPAVTTPVARSSRAAQPGAAAPSPAPPSTTKKKIDPDVRENPFKFQPEDFENSKQSDKLAGTLKKALAYYDNQEYYSASIEFHKVIVGINNKKQARRQQADFWMGKTLFHLRYFAPAEMYFRQISDMGEYHRYYNATMKWRVSIHRKIPYLAGVRKAGSKSGYIEELNRELQQLQKSPGAWKPTAIAGVVLQHLVLQKAEVQRSR